MKLKESREMYPEGTQIVLTEMAGESQMPYGLKGTVKFVDDAGQIHMSWEMCIRDRLYLRHNGSTH